jgi:2-keto-4-pentenoate hydratase
MVSQVEVVDGMYVARRDGSQPSGLGQVQFGLDEALDVQLAVLRRFQAEGDTLGGWKVGLTSGKARDLMGKDFRPFGYVLKHRILQSGAAVAVANIMDCQLEPEICLIVGSPLRGDDVDVARAKAAVRAAKAISEFDGKDLKGRSLKVNETQPREPGGGGRDSRGSVAAAASAGSRLNERNLG